MFIHDMTREECIQTLKGWGFGRLGCAHDNQPYIVPIYFACNNPYLYAMSTTGKKIDFMRVNPLVCVECDEIVSHDEWSSVIVFGRYEELPDLSEFSRARAEALDLLTKRSAWWWEPACLCDDHRDTPHSCTPVPFRIHIDSVSGRRATPT